MTATTNVGGKQGPDRPKPEAVAKTAFEKVRDQFLKSAKIDLTAAGPLVKAAVDEVEKMLLAAALGGGSIKSELILAGYQQLRHAHSRDEASKFQLGDAPTVASSAHGVIPSAKREDWLTKLPNGKFELKLPAAHLLTQLLQKVGLDPKSLSETAIKKIEEYGQDAKWNNLTAAATWKEVGAKLRGIALDEGVNGGPTTASVKRTMNNASAQLPSTHEPSAMQADLGLKKIATERSNTGSTSNATNIRAALLTGTKAKNGADEAAKNMVDALLKDLKIGDVSTGLKTDLIASMKEALKDPSSADGSVRPLEVLANAYRITLSKLPEDHPKASFQLGLMLAEGLGQITKGQTMSPGLDRAFAEMAMWGLTDMTTTILGKPPQNASQAVQQKLFGVLGQLGKNSPLARALVTAGEEQAGVQRKPKAEKTQAAPKTERTEKKAKTEGPEQTEGAKGPDAAKDQNEANIRQAVRGILNSVGVFNLEDPRAKKLEGAITEVLKQGLDEPSFAINGWAWIAKNTGLFGAKAEQVAAQVPAYLDNVKKAQGLIADLNQQQAVAEAKLEASTEKPERERLQGELEQIEANMKMARGMFNEAAEPILEWQNEAIRYIAQFCMNETGFRDVYGGGGGGDIGGAGGGGNGGNGGAGGTGGPRANGGGGRGDDDDGEPSLFKRTRPTHFNLPGIFSNGGPKDDPSELTLQQQRALKCSAILADPSLSIEDKIFLFMMWFVAFTDREREKQLEDIVGMDSRQAQRAEAIEKTQKREKAQKQEVDRAEGEMRVAKRDMAEAKAKPGGENTPEFKDAQARFSDAEGRFKQSSDRLDEASGQLKRLERDHDSAPQSREVKFTELQRLSQLRDNILNMARSIMETSNRNIEKVFR